MVFCFCVVLYVALCGLQACTMTLYLCVVKWLVLYWEHEEGVKSNGFHTGTQHSALIHVPS